MIQPLYLCGHLQAVQKCKSQNYNGQQHFKGQTEISSCYMSITRWRPQI